MPSDDDMSKFIDECLNVHNEYRKRHQVASLKHNSELTKMAQKWADHLAKTDTFQHSRERQYKGEQLGENIAMKWTSTGDDFTGGQVADQWYSEIERYNFGTHGGPSTGHFTQVVWKDSKEFGIGKAKTKDGKWLVVANYNPAGNFMGKNAENVLPPAGGDKSLIGSKDDDNKQKGRETIGQKIAGIFKGSDSDSDSDEEKRKLKKKLAATSLDGQSSQKTITTREETLPDGRKKTVVTETTVSADGKKSTVTRETISNTGEKREPPPKRKTQDLKDFVEEVVKEHNRHRKAHGKVGDLKHNKDLDALAQRWAEHLAATNDLKYSNDTYKGEELGENIASKWATGGADYTGEEVIDQWYKEHVKFDFSADHQPGTGHFTQIVWDGSKEIGVGKAHSKDGRVFVVCNYHPAGNVLGKFRDNVKPK